MRDWETSTSNDNIRIFGCNLDYCQFLRHSEWNKMLFRTTISFKLLTSVSEASSRITGFLSNIDDFNCAVRIGLRMDLIAHFYGMGCAQNHLSQLKQSKNMECSMQNLNKFFKKFY